MEIEGIIKDRDFKTSLLSDKNHVIGVTFQHRRVKLFDPIMPTHFENFNMTIRPHHHQLPKVPIEMRRLTLKR